MNMVNMYHDISFQCFWKLGLPPEGGGFLDLYTFGGLLVLVVQIASRETVYTFLENVTSLFIGTIWKATTFASAKVKKAIGRIGIFGQL